MSARERYIKVIESLVEGEDAKATELLHEAFVEKAREIWNDLVEADEIVEDEVAEEELEESFGDEEADDFIDDIEEDEDEIEAEEAFGEADEDDMDDMDAEAELADAGDEMDFDMDGETDEHEEEHEEIEDKLMSVEDALADLKAEFAKMMGDDAEEEAEEEMEEELAFESDEADEEIEEAAEEDADETLEEGAELTKVGKDGMHPADMPAGDDGKASPVAGENDMGGEAVDMSAKGSEGSDNGLVDAPKDMNVTHPGDGADLKAEPKGHGAEKKGKAE